MTIPKISKERLQAAFEEFDRTLRASDEWRGWEDDKNHKYALIEKGQKYPVKKVISIATGVPVGSFSGGPEAINYVRDMDCVVEALRLPSESETRAALHDLLLDKYPSAVEPTEAYDALGKYFGLSRSLRSLPMPNGENHFENRVRQARRKLVAANLLDPSTRGAWFLPKRSEPKIWVEKTDVKGESHRALGEFAFGKRLWSPTRGDNGSDVYEAMRRVQEGDKVLHLVDGRHIVGVSTIAGHTELGAKCPEGSKWAGRPAYTVTLEDFHELRPPLEREEFLKNAATRPALSAVLEKYDKLFFNKDFDLNQGAYFTEAPDLLVEVLDKAYAEKTGTGLPIGSMRSSNITILGERLDAAKKIFEWVYGPGAFEASRYFEEERSYKDELSREWRGVSTKSNFDAALASANPEKFASDLVAPLLDTKKSNFLPWRYSDPLKHVRDRETAIVFLQAARDLLFPEGTSDTDIDAFNGTLKPIYEVSLNETAVKPASHVIPSLMLWLQDPAKHFLVRPEIYNRLADCLTGSGPEGQGQIMTTAYYSQAVRFAQKLLTNLKDLGARDLIDVQGFAWGVFRHSAVWFGGKSYGGTVDMLPEFQRRAVYAIGFGEAGERGSVLENADQLSKAEREERRAKIEGSDASSAEKKAFTAFLDLAAAPGSLIFAKSTWYDRKVGASLVRISAVGVTENGYRHDPQVGHMLPTSWRSNPDAIFESAAHFPKINNTLSRLSLRETLDLMSKQLVETIAEEPVIDSPDETLSQVTAPIELQPRYTEQDFLRETGFTAEQLGKLQRQLRRKQQIVLQGPPGTGKTFVAERLARLLVSETQGNWSVVQFHPSYSYEDFMIGIRPKVINDTLAFDLEKGRFLEFCKDAAAAPTANPFILIIDEINRADLSRVFGELMYLLEYRDKDIPLASGTPFHIPENVFLIGTMNTADRSIALVDHALRRRFTFMHLGPDYDVLTKHLAAHNLSPSPLIEVLKSVNAAIADRNYQIGISFFMKDGAALPRALQDVWEGEIEPYLDEYFFDQPTKVDPFRWTQLAASFATMGVPSAT
jgi:MoxR-like ATPase